MGATVYTDARVFSMDLGEMLEGCDLLDSSNALIVLAASYEKNCYPHTPSWGLFFIGTESEFQNKMLPWMMDAFDDGISQGPIAANGKALKQYLINKLMQKKPATAADLHSVGYFGFSYSKSDFNKLEDKEGYCSVQALGKDRYGHLIKSENDLKKLIKAVMDIRQDGDWWHGTPWKVRDNDVSKMLA